MAKQTWTDPVLDDTIVVKDTHFRELIEAINDWEEAYGITESHYNQPISLIDEDIDFTDFTEVDPGSDTTVASNVITVSSLPADINTYVYKDYGVSGPFNREQFSIGLNQLVDINISSIDNAGVAIVWGLSNYYNETLQQHRDNTRKYLFIYAYRNAGTYYIKLEEGHDGGLAEDSYSSFSLSTDYFLSIERNEKIGANGRVYCYIYSDSERTTLIDTLQIDLHDAFTNYRYLYGLKSYGAGSTESTSMTISNLKIPKEKVDDTSVDEMQVALDALKTLVDADTFVWNVADPGDPITGGDPTDFVDQLRTNMEYLQDDKCYLCHTCDSYSSCSCNASCHEYSACSCNSTCYNEGCGCNTACYGYVSCSCNNTCYLHSKSNCSCDKTCYSYHACSCNSTCYKQSCSCNSTCYSYVPCSCNSTCYSYACSKCDITDYEYPWS